MTLSSVLGQPMYSQQVLLSTAASLPQHCHSIKGHELSWAHISLPMSEPCSVTAGDKIWHSWVLAGLISKDLPKASVHSG